MIDRNPDSLTEANDAIRQAFSDMQAALVNRLMGLLAHYETSVFKRLDALETQIIELRGVVELQIANATADDKHE